MASNRSVDSPFHYTITLLDVRLLIYTNLYPSAALPRHGIFVEERLRHLVASGRVDAQVCALRPRNTLNPGLYFGNAQKTESETRHGLRVTYKTVPTLPYISNWIDPLLWARASRAVVTTLVGSSRSDIILDAHFVYPDAVAAVILGRNLGVPVVMTARGSDVNVKCENPVMRRWVCWAARQCAAVITVSQALANRLGSFGVSAEKTHVLPNGVDLHKFKPHPSTQLPPSYEAEGAVWLSVGHLLEAKGHHLAIEALTGIPDATLLIVGEGPQEQSLRALARQLGVAARVRFLGHIPHEQMAKTYSAAKFTILASSNEGMPNVMLESLACGTRVIATEVGGISEVITSPVAGSIMASRSAAEIVNSAQALAKSEITRNRTRVFAQDLGWEPTVRRQLSLYENILGCTERDDHGTVCEAS